MGAGSRAGYFGWGGEGCWRGGEREVFRRLGSGVGRCPFLGGEVRYDGAMN